MAELRIAVIGAGIIGGTHMASLEKVEGMSLSAIVDPTDAAAEVAAARGVPHLRDVEELIASGLADGAIVATPNETHVPIGEALLRAGIPALVEKPVANSIDEGERLLKTVEETGVPLLVGHHRRHNPMIRAVRAAIDDGSFGRLVTANVIATMAKPAFYFDVKWRIAERTGGPLLINMIHEIDMLRFFFGEVAQVTGRVSNEFRGNPVEDIAAAILNFRQGGIATLTVTDAGCGPWSYDLSSGESPRLPRHDISAHLYAGTKAGISLPDASFWTYPGTPDWAVEMQRGKLDFTPADPFPLQMAHFGAVIRGEEKPRVSCADGVANMHVIAAIKQSAAEGRPVDL
ncbi:Gfo/Idh/MocA family protein [Pseudoruegeria sp. HB172150]|uniref:Gfo/Idh/MocA family protein n=1 Tax=Pseudoruegeria sp. HB172150 TaxID=2721164 RepID=UPI001555FD19|nr:Gfo/Idh/MocA family oxidoreductase [Pseudoruegeria sp. HB172150]